MRAAAIFFAGLLVGMMLLAGGIAWLDPPSTPLPNCLMLGTLSPWQRSVF
jgi:hypothetical protein